MPRIQIEISSETAQSITELAERCTVADQERGGATTHGPLTATGFENPCPLAPQNESPP